MSDSKCMDMKKLVMKTEPADSFEEDNFHDIPSRKSKRKSLRRQPKKNVFAEVDGKHETKEADWDRDYDNFNETTEKVKKIKKSNSHSNVTSTDHNDSVDEFLHVTDIKRSDSPEETVSHSHSTDFPHSSGSSIIEESEDQKPSQEELEIYYRVSSKLNLTPSLCESENVSHLIKDPTKIKNDSVYIKRQDCSRGSSDLNLLTPGVKHSPVSRTPLADAPLRRYTTRLSSKKRDSSPERFLDSEIMKPVLGKDGSTTYYQCGTCSKVFNKRATLRQHFITHTDRFACPSCATRCKSKGDLIRHIQTHTKEKPYHCDICNTDYTRESILKKHMQTQLHLRACFERENLNNSGKNMDIFVTAQTKLNLDFPCSLCPKVTFSKSEFTKHARSHVLKYMCNICQKGCKNPLLLKIHKRSHSKTTNLTCKLCSRSFASFYCLKEHVKSHRSGSSSKVTEMAVTKYLNKHKSTKYSAKRRFQSENDSKPASSRIVENISTVVTKLECGDCHKTFSNKRQLDKHICVSDEIYVCGVCTKTFSNFSKLKVHLKLHDKILKCDICDITFDDDKELEDHVQKLHVEENDYTCRLCYEHFNRASDLESHMNDHNPTMLFSGRSLNESTMPTRNTSKRKHCSSASGQIKITKTGASRDFYYGLKNHKDDYVPTMLFSGRSLDEQAQHGANKTKSKPSSGNDIMKYTKTEALSDIREVNVSEKYKKLEAPKSSDSDDDSILDSQEFYEILNNAVDGSDDNLNDSEISDSDEELYSGIKAVLENEIMNSEESDENGFETPFLLKKPLVYGYKDIMKKHGSEFDRYSEKDGSSQSFRCKMCDKIFRGEKYLKNHLKHHVCEFCNTFFSDKEKLSAHKSNHVTQLLKQIRTEATRLHIPKQKWLGYFMGSSESENDLEDQILNKTEDVFEDEPSQAANTTHFKHTLSHDEIVQANKHLFEKYSCLDPENNIFACTICKRNYARPTTLTRHFKTHVCQLCNTFFKDKTDLLEHKYSHHKKAECTGEDSKIPSSCLISKPNRDMFKKYSFIDVNRNVFRCTLCNKGFVRRTVLTRHLKTHICSHCDQFFEDKYDLVKHVITIHEVEKQYSDSDDADIDDLDSDDDDDDDEKPCFASTVVENVGNEVKNIIHLSLPQASSSFQAQPTCSNRNERITFTKIPSTTTSETMDTKMASVPGTIPSLQILSKPVQVYKNISHNSFSNASTSYNENKPKKITAPQPQSFLIEERDRPYECGVCGKRFLKNDHLKSHMTIHTGDRPFICCLCDKAFGRSTILQKHLKTHVKICKICDATFNFKNELDLHMDDHRTYMFHK